MKSSHYGPYGSGCTACYNGIYKKILKYYKINFKKYRSTCYFLKLENILRWNRQ